MEGDDDTLLFIWPTTIVHRIDEESPFYNMSAKDFLRKHYEIIVALEGIVEPTGNSIQARSSYLGDEILWGHRFSNVLHFKEGCYHVDYSAFDRVQKVDTPTCSAKHQAESSKSEEEAKRPEAAGGVTPESLDSAEATIVVGNDQAQPVRVVEHPHLQKVSFVSQSPHSSANCTSRRKIP